MSGGVLVLGSSNTDLVLRGDHLPSPGQTVLGRSFHQAFGGKGANQAVAARRAGAETALIAGIGGDAHGQAAFEHLRAEGLDLGHARVFDDLPGGLAFILLDNAGQNMISVHPGANAALTAADIAALPPGAFEGRNVFITQLETPVEAVAAGLARARREGLLTVLNPAPAMPLGRGMMREVDLLVPNEGEAAMLVGHAVHGVRDARQAARTLLDQGLTAVIITLGPEGSLAAWRRDDRGGEMIFEEHVPAPPVKAVDTVAAGDAYIGALAASLARHIAAGGAWQGHLLSAMQFATRAAALSVTRHGAQDSLATLDEIEAFHPAP